MSASEAHTQQAIREGAPFNNVTLWRNNRGAMQDDNGRVIRFGLANDSKKIDEKLKSSDLIGITPIIIKPEHVGCVVGVFTSIEVKRPGWLTPSNAREHAQNTWLELVRRNGGLAMFATDAQQVWNHVREWRK